MKEIPEAFPLKPEIRDEDVYCHHYYFIYAGTLGSFGEGNGTPLQYSCLENPMDGGPWQAAVHGVAKSRTRLSDFTFTFHFSALEKKWQPTPVFLPGESQGWGSLVGCRLWGRTESDTTEATQQQHQVHSIRKEEENSGSKIRKQMVK